MAVVMSVTCNLLACPCPPTCHCLSHPRHQVFFQDGIKPCCVLGDKVRIHHWPQFGNYSSHLTCSHAGTLGNRGLQLLTINRSLWLAVSTRNTLIHGRPPLLVPAAHSSPRPCLSLPCSSVFFQNYAHGMPCCARQHLSTASCTASFPANSGLCARPDLATQQSVAVQPFADTSSTVIRSRGTCLLLCRMCYAH